MASCWANDDAVNEQINSTIEDADYPRWDEKTP